MVEDVRTIPLTRHVDDRGHLMEILRPDADPSLAFGQVYATTRKPQPGLPSLHT